MASAKDIAVLRIQLDEIEPAIWRRVAVPLSTTLKSLHDIIQATMGWLDCHLYLFEVGGLRYGDPDPEYDFDPPMRRASSAKLGKLIDRGESTFTYVYDFGDNWRHTLAVERIEERRPNVPYPCFIEGARRCPPEDVGSIHGFADFLEAVTTRGHPERKAMLTWYGGPYDPKDINRQMIEYRFSEMWRRQRRSPNELG